MEKQNWDRDELKGNTVFPVGVSEWREYGKRHGYWNYFISQVRQDLKNEITEGARLDENISGEEMVKIINLLNKFK